MSDSELSDVRSERKPQDAGPDSIYLPFVSDGLVSLMADGVTVPVKIQYSMILKPPNPFCYKVCYR